jgi:Type VI secretion system/phage-baseplate injector OB domain
VINAEDRLMSQLAADRRHQFYGKYRAIVKTVMDGNDLGKLIVTLPEIYDDQDSPPAWPCVPYAGPKHGFVSLPEEGDGVWIECEGGDPSNPIWTGFWWPDGGMPSSADTNVRTWATSKGLKIVLDDDESELTLEHPSGASISLSDDGLTLSFNSTTITLTDDGVSISGTVDVSPSA